MEAARGLVGGEHDVCLACTRLDTERERQILDEQVNREWVARKSL